MNKQQRSKYNKNYYQEHRKILLERHRIYGRTYIVDPIRTKNNEKRRIRPKNYKEKVSDYLLKRKYGISLSDKHAIIEKQKGTCAICNLSMKKACLDHDHQTGKIRGVLCDTCNRGLGFFKDNRNLLRSALAYLDKDVLYEIREVSNNESKKNKSRLVSTRTS